MARKIIQQLVDDIDGTELGPGEGESILFAIGGTGYEIDLSNENADKLRQALAPYIAKSRRVAAGRARGIRPPQRRPDVGAIREWARSNGFEISERGRLSAEIVNAYDAINQK